MKRKILILFTLLLTLGAFTNFGTKIGLAQEDPGFEWDSGGGPPPNEWQCQLRIFTQTEQCNAGYTSAFNGWVNSPRTCVGYCAQLTTPQQRQEHCDSHCPEQDHAICVSFCLQNFQPTCYENCQTDAQNNYIRVSNEYGSCLSSAMSCTYQPDFCATARIEAARCAAFYAGNPETIGEFMACRNASGIDRCQ